MTLYEYVCNITANGSRIIMPDFTAIERRETIGEPGNNITRIMWIEEQTKAERREEKEDTGKQLRKVEKILEKVCEQALVCKNAQQFYRKCFAHCPLDVRTGEYDESKWSILQEDLVNEIMAHFMRKSFVERQSPAAKFLYGVIKDRLETFNNKGSLKVEKEEGVDSGLSVTFNIK